MRTRAAKLSAKTADTSPGVSGLAIASQNSASEQMADRIATRITSQSNDSYPGNPYKESVTDSNSDICSFNKHNTIFRSSNNTAPVQNKNLHSVSKLVGNSTHGGEALSTETRNYFEPRFGHDFSDIRVHNYPEASKAAENIQAKAFTYNKDIYFNKSQFAPESSGGKWLLAHELTHTLQGNDNVVNRSPMASAAANDSVGEFNDKQGEQSNASDSKESIDAIISELENSLNADPEDQSGVIKARLTSLNPSTRMQVITTVRSRLPESSRKSFEKILSELPASESKVEAFDAKNKQQVPSTKDTAKTNEQLKQKERNGEKGVVTSGQSEPAKHDAKSEKDKIKSGVENQNKKDQNNEQNDQTERKTKTDKLGKDTRMNQENILGKENKESSQDDKKVSDDGLQSLSELLTQNDSDEQTTQAGDASNSFEVGAESGLTANEFTPEIIPEFSTETPDVSGSDTENRQGIIQSAIENITQNSVEAKTSLADQSSLALDRVRAQARRANGSASALVKKGGEELGNKFKKQRDQLKLVIDAAAFQIDGQSDARQGEADKLEKDEKKAVKGVFSGHRKSVDKTVSDNISAAEKLRTRYGNMIHNRITKQADSARQKGNSRAALYPNTLRGVTIQNAVRSVAYKTEKKIKEKEPDMVQSVEKITAVIPQEFKVKGKEVLEGFDDNLPEILLEVAKQIGLLKDNISSQADEAHKQLTEAKNKFSEQLNTLENTAASQLRSLLPQVQARIARARRSAIRGINKAKGKTNEEIDKKTLEATEILQSTSDPDAQNTEAFVNEVNTWISGMADETNNSVSETVDGLAQQFSRAGAGTRKGVRKVTTLVEAKLAEITKKRDDWAIKFVELVDKGYGASITHISKEFSRYRDQISKQLSPVVTKLQSEFKDTLDANEAKIKEAVNIGLAENDKALNELSSAMSEAASDTAWDYDHPILSAIGSVFSWIGKILAYIAGAIIAIAVVIIVIVIVVVLAKLIIAAAAAAAAWAGATAAVVATVKVVVGLVIAAGFLGYTAYTVNELYEGYRAAGLGRGESIKNALKDISGISDIQQSFSDPDLSPFDRGYKFGRGAATLISTLIGGRKLIGKFRGKKPPKITNPAKPKGIRAKFNKTVEAIGTKATGRLDKFTARKIAENAKKSLPPPPAPIPKQVPPPVKQAPSAQSVPLPKTKPLALEGAPAKAPAKPVSTPKKPKLELVVDNKNPIQAPKGSAVRPKKPGLKLVESKPVSKEGISPVPKKPVKPVKAANDNALPAEQSNVVKLEVPQQQPLQAVAGQQRPMQAVAGGGGRPMGIRQNGPTAGGIKQPVTVASTGAGSGGKGSNQLSLPFKQSTPSSGASAVTSKAGGKKASSLSIVKPKKPAATKPKAKLKAKRQTPAKKSAAQKEWKKQDRDRRMEEHLKSPKPEKGTPEGNAWRYVRYRLRDGQRSFSEWLKLSKGGKSGGPNHQAIQKNIAASRGARTEVRVANADGTVVRYADAYWPKGPNGKPVYHQIGGVNPGGGKGGPIARERRAIRDIRDALKQRGEDAEIWFWDKSKPGASTPAYKDPDFAPSWVDLN